MKLFLVLPCLVAVSLAAPAHDHDHHLRLLPALRHEEVHDEFGQYAMRYITAENTVVSERGRLVPTAEGGYVLEIDGQYEFVGDDNKVYATRYHGGPGGFKVDGEHLPVSVPVPAV